MNVQDAMERALGFCIIGKGYPLTPAEEASVVLRAEVIHLRAQADKLEAALDYAIACLPDAPLNAKEKLRAALGREA